MASAGYSLHWFVIGAEFPIGRFLISELNESATSYSSISLESRDFSAIRNSNQTARPVAIISCLPQELPDIEHVRFWLDVLKQYDIPVIVLSTTLNSISDEHRSLSHWYYNKELISELETLAQNHERHLVLRFNDVFSFYKNDFALKLLAQMKDQGSLVLDDNYYTYPTPADDCAEIIIACMNQINCDEKLWGTYGYVAAEPISLYNFSEVLLAEASQYEAMNEVSLVAERTISNLEDVSVLNCEDIKFTFGIKPRPWRYGLSRLIKKYYNSDE